jgi:hypothetical protein
VTEAPEPYFALGAVTEEVAEISLERYDPEMESGEIEFVERDFVFVDGCYGCRDVFTAFGYTGLDAEDGKKFVFGPGMEEEKRV